MVVWCSNENCFFLYFNGDWCFLVRKQYQEENFKNSTESELRNMHIHICSKNNFPTAAGLASSAAGYSCLGITVDNGQFSLWDVYTGILVHDGEYNYRNSVQAHFIEGIGRFSFVCMISHCCYLKLFHVNHFLRLK